MILLVEDDPVTCHIMSAMLKRLRQPHVVAHSGAEAAAHAARLPIDLIVADVRLPDADGLDLVEELTGRPHMQDVPVMFCTMHADPQTVTRAVALGAVDFVKKPINVDGFATRVMRALKRAPMRWEPWRDVVRRLHVDARTFEPLLALARDGLADLVRMIGGIVEGRTTIDEVGPDVLAARVVGVRGAALNVGAVRTVQLIDLLWSGEAAGSDLPALHAALRAEHGAFDLAIQRRGAATADAVA